VQKISGTISWEGAAMKFLWLQHVWYVVRVQLDPLYKPDSWNKFHSHQVYMQPHHKSTGKLTTYD